MSTCIRGLLHAHTTWSEDVAADCPVEGGKETIGKVHYLAWGIHGMARRWLPLMNMGRLGEVWGIEAEQKGKVQLQPYGIGGGVR